MSIKTYRTNISPDTPLSVTTQPPYIQHIAKVFFKHHTATTVLSMLIIGGPSTTVDFQTMMQEPASSELTVYVGVKPVSLGDAWWVECNPCQCMELHPDHSVFIFQNPIGKRFITHLPKCDSYPRAQYRKTTYRFVDHP